MAKEVKPATPINRAEDLVTSREKTRTGFIAMALEKNMMARPYIDEAKALKALASQVVRPMELLAMKDVREGLLTASGLSQKALVYLNEDDKQLAIRGLIEEFLEPAGEDFIDELVYRYLLTKGDALGGKARNLAGSLGERKFLRTLLSVLNLGGTKYYWRDKETGTWLERDDDIEGIEKRICGLHWQKDGRNRLLVMNVNVKTVTKNIDLCILDGTTSDLKKGKASIFSQPEKFLALGELKGGIDPAGADEHWKTANSALIRIRSGFSASGHLPQTFFIGAAIEKSMADEMFKEFQAGILNNVANLTVEDQLAALCHWLVNL